MKIKSKSYILLLLLLITNYISYSQDLIKLSEDRGFREIKLGSNIKQFNCFELNNSFKPNLSLMLYQREIANEISAYKFIPNKDYPYYKIGNIDILQISVLVYQDKIFEIKIQIQKNNDILELLKYRYGNYTKFDNFLMPKYRWETEGGITCELLGYGMLETNSYFLDYTDNSYWKTLEEKNKQKEESIKQGKENELKKQAKNQF